MKRSKQWIEEEINNFMAYTGNKLIWTAKPGNNLIYCFDNGQVLNIREIELFNTIYFKMKNKK